MLYVTVHVQSRMRAQHIFWFREDILYERARNNAKRNFAIDSAESKVINLVSKRRNVRSLGRIEVNRKNILSVEIDMWRQVERKRRVSTLVFTEFGAVDPDGRSRHGTLEVHKHMLAACFGRKPEAATITRHEFVALLIEAVPRDFDVGVRNDHALVTRVIKVA